MALKKKTFADLITFTGGSVATYFDASGILRTAGVDEPRFQYDPVTGEELGLLIEEQRTNVLLHNRDLSQAAWTDGAGTPTISQDEVGIDGVSSKAWTVTDDDTSFTESREQTISIADDSATHAFSAYIKKDPSATAVVHFQCRLIGGTPVNGGVVIDPTDGSFVGDQGTFNVDDFGDWWRVRGTVPNNSTGNTTLQLRINPAWSNVLELNNNNNATGSCVYDFGQVELNASFVSSPIETGASQVTRSADVATSAVGDEFNAEEFSYVVAGRTPPFGSIARTVLNFNDDVNQNRFLIFRENDNTMRVLVTASGATVASFNLGVIANDTDFKITARCKANDFAAAINGGSPVSDTGGNMPTSLVTRHIGKNHNGTAPWSSTIKSIREFPYALTDAELTAESAL